MRFFRNQSLIWSNEPTICVLEKSKCSYRGQALYWTFPSCEACVELA
jgi:hypothetical protein